MGNKLSIILACAALYLWKQLQEIKSQNHFLISQVHERDQILQEQQQVKQQQAIAHVEDSSLFDRKVEIKDDTDDGMVQACLQKAAKVRQARREAQGTSGAPARKAATQAQQPGDFDDLWNAPRLLGSAGEKKSA